MTDRFFDRFFDFFYLVWSMLWATEIVRGLPAQRGWPLVLDLILLLVCCVGAFVFARSLLERRKP